MNDQERKKRRAENRAFGGQDVRIARAALKAGLTVGEVVDMVKQLGCKAPRRVIVARLRSARMGPTRALTSEDVRLIREARTQGSTLEEIRQLLARKAGVRISRQTIYNYLKRAHAAQARARRAERGETP